MILLASYALLSTTKHTEKMLTKGWRGYLQERKTWWVALCWVLYISLLFGSLTTTLYKSSIEYKDQRPLSLKDTFKSLSLTLCGQAQILTCTECLRPQGQLVTGKRPQVKYPGLGMGDC